MGEIVRVMEGGTAITDCTMENDTVCGVCSRAGACLLRHVWMETSQAMFDALDKFRIDELIKKPEDFLKGKGDDSPE